MQQHDTISNLSARDAVLIPGGGVRAGGALPPWVTARLNLALRFAGEPLLMPLSAGTPYRPPPMDERGFPITEARAAARYLLEHGAGPRRILMEESSYDTLGNAFFSRVNHVIPGEIPRIVVVTSEFHMPRVEAVFEWVYSLSGPVRNCVVSFVAAPNVGIEEDALRARMEKERTSLLRFRTLQSRIQSLAQLHYWLFTEHEAYRVRTTPPDLSHVDARTY